MSSKGNINFQKHLNECLDQRVRVNMEYEDKWYIGVLSGVDQQNQSIVLINVTDESNNTYDKIFIRGNVWSTMIMEKAPFPMVELAERLKRHLPNEEVFVDEDGVIELMNGRIKIDQYGVEGMGATKNRLQKVYDQFLIDNDLK